MIILYMWCALFVVKYFVTSMQSVNIHITKIFNKTCRWLFKILGLICTFSKLFSFYFLFIFKMSFFFLFCKTADTSMRILRNLEVTSFLYNVLHPELIIDYVQQLCIFLRHVFLMKWCLNAHLTPTYPNDKMVRLSPVAEEIFVLNMEFACRELSSM